MLRNLLVFFTGLTGALALTGGAAMAQNDPDYVFTVPVNATDIHAGVDRIGVTCILKDSTSTSASVYNTLGTGRSDVAVTGPDYSGTFTVEVNFEPQHVGTQPAGWRCNVTLHDETSPDYTGWGSPSQSPTSNPLRRDVRPSSLNLFTRHGTF
jgi:hypothetical protein